MRLRIANAIHVIGLLNVAYSLAGLYLLVHSVVRFRKNAPWPDQLAYERETYYASTSINLVFVVLLLVAGLLLLRLDRRGTVLCNYVFVLEILYWIGSDVLSLGLTMWGNQAAVLAGRSIGAVGGIGNMGLAIQILTGYPLLALVAVNLVRRRLDRNNAWAN